MTTHACRPPRRAPGAEARGHALVFVALPRERYFLLDLIAFCFSYELLLQKWRRGHSPVIKSINTQLTVASGSFHGVRTCPLKAMAQSLLCGHAEVP